VKTHLLDHDPYRRARVVQAQHRIVSPQPTGQRGQVKHQRRIAEYEFAEIDDHVAPGIDGAGEGPAPVALGRLVLISSTTQYG
jgi:hypothetical protein